MASPDRRAPAAVIDRLYAQPWRFEFCQAVRLLEQLVDAPAPVGASANPRQEPVRFRAATDFAFQGAAIRQIDPPTLPLTPSMLEGFLARDRSIVAQAGMSVSFIGLAGTVGALPMVDTERVLRGVQQRDPALADFLALFENRLIAVYYRARKTHRLGFDAVPPEYAPMAGYLQCLMGLGLPGIGADFPDTVRRRLLPFAGLLASTRRPLEGLGKLLAAVLRAPVALEGPIRRLQRVPADQCTALGLRQGRFQALGIASVLGSRLQAGGQALRLWIGPMSRAAYDRLLPGEADGMVLDRLVRLYLGDGYAVEIRPVLHASGISAACLSAHRGARLGLTSWLCAKPARQDSCEARLTLGQVA
ncbi:MAG: type VI secretion system baseplate subunit TssG [Alphaproteobacteria bacterium]|nr:type VI secretion system baseplate subunit TssG [Alphaproteobacteria bacterium]MBU0795770.1 type VI secretion system baseplate subunit TssG [Alphaproteobacteria bacterium]MBU0887393.1 type VI secretion system baseplate subunit TssG [Alphaproteobacteria bacterium]MBU1811726.1 type VI secretion system baseplate subunit TssG [Alphaproteobacteria bacterium]